MKALILALLLIAISQTVFAGTQTQRSCSFEQGINYCYYPGETEEVLYYFHGFRGNHRSWSFSPMGSGIQEQWDNNHTAKPHVITISFGDMWWFDNYFYNTIENFMEWAPENLLGFEPIKTSIYGNSMGGYNALRFYSQTDRKIDRLALSCPATPNSLSENSPSTFSGNPLISIPTNDVIYMENDNDWTIESNLDVDTSTKFYVGATPTDLFGFYEGNVNLYHVITELGADAVYDEQDADHCSLETSVISDFLVN